uniref:Uncharacterized protein n=1 Tax=Oryza glumipatula TaxID=40148 RepID=A0A0E0A9W0_9ORYZ
MDTGSDVELGTRCSIHEKERTRDMNELGMRSSPERIFDESNTFGRRNEEDNFGETRLLQGGQGFDDSICKVPRFNYVLSYHGNLVKMPKLLR